MINLDNQFAIDADVAKVIARLRLFIINGKLKDVQDKPEDVVVSCPFHNGGQEEHGSCFVRKKDGVYHCFGCGAKGPFVRFVAACLNSSDDYAKSWLLKNFGGEAIERPMIMGDDIKLPQLGVRQGDRIDPAELDQYLTWTPYLAQRKLSRDICELFQVRYDPKHRQVIFPVHDPKGRLVMLAKRSIDTKTFYLDKDVEKPIYCLDYVERNGFTTAMITEGPFDCLTGWEYGYPTIATLGKMSDNQIDQLNKSSIRVLYLAFDNDDAGRSFAATLKRKLAKHIMAVDIRLPKNKKDINDLTKEELDEAIKKSRESISQGV